MAVTSRVTKFLPSDKLQLGGADYDIHKIAAKIGKTPHYVAISIEVD